MRYKFSSSKILLYASLHSLKQDTSFQNNNYSVTDRLPISNIYNTIYSDIKEDNIEEEIIEKEVIEEAGHIIKGGGLVAFPTETVYGLGGDALNKESSQKIYVAKGRPSDNPLIVHICKWEDLEKIVKKIPESAKALANAFWPGPLTLVMKAKPGVLAPSVTAGLSTVGMRMPDHPVALQLLRALKKPLAAPSANRSGKPSPTKAAHVAEDLNDIIPYIVDGGTTGIGIESTVLDVTHEPPVILRPGGVTKEMLEEVIGAVIEPTHEEQKIESTPKAPGMKYTHYAPEAPVYLIDEKVVFNLLL